MSHVFQAADIKEEAKQIFGSCSDQVLFSRISSAVRVLANTGEFDPLLGTVDVCVNGSNLITFPREVYKPLAINVDGTPSVPRGQLFSFHLNGPGDCFGEFPCSNVHWQDHGLVPTYRFLTEPAKLVAFVEHQLDENTEVWAYGFDRNNNEIKTVNANGTVTRGYRLPTIFGYALPDANAPIFSRVTRLRREEGAGTIRISSFDNDATTGTLLSFMQWDETDPQYRQVKLSRSCPGWARVHYRKKLYAIKSWSDLIPMSSMDALETMMQAIKFYKEGDLTRATALEATARRWITEATSAAQPITADPIQVMDTGNNIFDKGDQVD